MSGFWRTIGDKLSSGALWAITNHPGKTVGASLGFLLGLFLITIGFWRTLVLVVFVVLGFFLGKRQDDHKDVIAWLEKTFNKY